MAKRPEAIEFEPAELEIAGRVGRYLLGEIGFTTRGIWAKELEAEGILPQRARPLAAVSIGSLERFRDGSRPPMVRGLSGLMVEVTEQTLSDRRGSIKPEAVSILYNTAMVLTPEEAKAKYLEMQATRQAEAQNEHKDKDAKKEVLPPSFLMLAPYDNRAKSDAIYLLGKMQKSQQAHPEAQPFILKDIFFKVPAAVYLIEPDDALLYLKQGVTPEQINRWLPEGRAALISKAAVTEGVCRDIVANTITAAGNLRTAFPRKSLVMFVPVQRALIIPVGRLLEGQLPESLTLQRPNKVYYEPLLPEALEKWNTRYSKASVEAAFDKLSKDNPAMAEELLPFVENQERLTQDEPNQRLDEILASVIFSDDVIFKILLSDFIRKIYVGSAELFGEDKEMVEVAISCVVNQFKSAEEIKVLLIHQDVTVQIDKKKLNEDIDQIKKQVAALEAERTALSRRSDPVARQRRDKIPAMQRALEKDEKTLKAATAEAQRVQVEAEPATRIKKELRKRIPSQRPNKANYPDDRAYHLADDAHASLAFLSSRRFEG